MEGIIRSRVTLGTWPVVVDMNIDFLVIETLNAYNAILGRMSLNKAKAIVSTPHMLKEFSTLNGIG